MIYKSIKVSEQTAARFRDMKQKGTYDNALNILLDSAGLTVSPDTVRLLEKKFGKGSGSIDDFLKSYLIDDKNQRVEAIEKRGGGYLIDLIGDDEKALDNIENWYVDIKDKMVNEEGKINLQGLYKAIEKLAAGAISTDNNINNLAKRMNKND